MSHQINNKQWDCKQIITINNLLRNNIQECHTSHNDIKKTMIKLWNSSHCNNNMPINKNNSKFKEIMINNN